MKKILMTIVLGLMTATIVGYIYFSNLDFSQSGSDEAVLVQEGSSLASTTAETMKGKNSLISLFKTGKSIECTFSFSSNGVRGEGTGFFDNGNARVDSLYTGTGTVPTASYIISDSANKVMYTWTLEDGVSQGVKMALPVDASPSTPATSVATKTALSPATNVVTPQTAVEYDCKSWAGDNSVFVPPSDVEFIDMTNQQKQLNEIPSSVSSTTLPSR